MATNPDLHSTTDDVVRVHILNTTSTGDRWRTHVDYAKTPALPDLTSTHLSQFNAAWRAACLVAIRACMDDGSIVDFVICESRKNTGLFAHTAVVGSPGTVAGECLPPYCSAGLYYRTDLRGKKGRGMSRLGSVPESFNNDGLWQAAALVAYQAYAATLMGPITIALTGADPWAPVVSKQHFFNPGIGKWDLKVGNITSIPVQVRFGSQLSRKIGVGE